MKKLAVNASILVLSCLLIISKPARNLVESKAAHNWILVISPQTSKQHLDSVKTAWEKDNILLEFSNLKYDDSGKLVKIKGIVTNNTGGDHASANFSSENLKLLEIKVDDSPSISIKSK